MKRVSYIIRKNIVLIGWKNLQNNNSPNKGKFSNKRHDRKSNFFVVKANYNNLWIYLTEIYLYRKCLIVSFNLSLIRSYFSKNLSLGVLVKLFSSKKMSTITASLFKRHLSEKHLWNTFLCHTFTSSKLSIKALSQYSKYFPNQILSYR